MQEIKGLTQALGKFKGLYHLNLNVYQAKEIGDEGFELFVNAIKEMKLLTTLTFIYLYCGMENYKRAGELFYELTKLQFLTHLEVMIDWRAPNPLKNYMKKVHKEINNKGLSLLPFLNMLQALQKHNVLRYVKRKEYIWDLIYLDEE